MRILRGGGYPRAVVDPKSAPPLRGPARPVDRHVRWCHHPVMDEGEHGAVGEVTRPAVGAWTPPADGTPRPHRRSDQVFGAVLLALWLTWLVLTVVTQTRLVDEPRLRADLAAGRVAAWQLADLVPPEGTVVGWSEGVTVVPRAAGDDGADADPGIGGGNPVVAYRVDGWFAPVRVLDPNGLDNGTGGADATLRAAGVPQVSTMARWSPTLDGRDQWPLWTAAPLVLMTLGAIVVGPAPTRGTRWFWIWQLFVTLGLGVVAYAVLEQIRPVPPPGAPGARRRRRGGWNGVLVAVVTSILVGAGLTALAASTHWLWLL